jgi:predicted nucleic acid-binding protein
LERKLKAVIDTNLFISGLFAKDSLSAQLQDLKPTEANIRRFFRLIFRKAVISKDIYQTGKIVDDPTDNKFLACALEKKADYIVSRDPHLRNLKHFHGIQIVDATTFIEKLRGRS